MYILFNKLGTKNDKYNLLLYFIETYTQVRIVYIIIKYIYSRLILRIFYICL